MQIDDVWRALEKIRDEKGDDEVAHGLEDDLYVRVLEHIASGGENGALLAAEALKARAIVFSRWCA